jgi:shikimate kinase
VTQRPTAAVTTVAALRRLTGGNMNVELPSEAEAGEFMKALKEDSEKMDELTQAYKLLDR